jgi:hypothetical protein
LNGLELDSEILGDQLPAGEHGHVFQHGLAPIAEAWCLGGDAPEDTAQLIDDERSQGFSLNVLGGPPGRGRLRSELLFPTSLHIEFVSGVGVITAFSGCLIEIDGFAGATLGTDNFIRVNKPA